MNGLVIEKKKVFSLITKSNWGEKENRFSFSPVPQATAVVEITRQAVGGPTRLIS